MSMFSMFLDAKGEEQQVHHNIYTLQFVSEQFMIKDKKGEFQSGLKGPVCKN